MGSLSRAAVALAIALLASSCRCGGAGEAPALLDLRQLPRLAACEGGCEEVLLAELTAAVRARPPLALFPHQTVASPARAIEELRTRGWTVRGQTFPVEIPIDWGADPFESRNWRFRLNALYFVVPFLQHHAETGSEESLAHAAAVLLDWGDYNLVRDRPNPFRWYDHATGLRATHLGYVIDRGLRGGTLSAPDLHRLLVLAGAHLEHLLDPAQLAPNNHALFQLAGLAGLCRAVPELARCEGAAAYASREFARIVTDQFGEDAVHTENSPFYHGYALTAIDRVVDTGWLEISPASRARLEQALHHLPWLIRPDGFFAQNGDSHGRPGQRAVLRALPTPGGGGDTHRVFPAAGYAVVRARSREGPAQDAYLLLTAGFQSRAHKHWDAQSFEWFDRGRPVLVDSGVYGTNRDERRDYVVSTRAHNTIEIDGRDSDGGTPPRPPEVLAVERSGPLFAILAEVTHLPSRVRHRRLLLLHPGRWLLVHDELHAVGSRTFTAWFHPDPGYTTREASRGQLHADHAGGGPPLEVVDLTGEAQVTIARGQTEPRLQGWVTGSYNELVPADAIGLTRQGNGATFTTLIILDPGPERPRLAGPTGSGPATSLCWQDGAGIHGARVTVDGGRLALSSCPGAALTSGEAPR